MPSLNQVTIYGRLTRDPEYKDTAGGRLAALGVALNRSWKDKNDEWQEATDFVDVTLWNPTSKQEEDLVKGANVLISGRLSTRSWEAEDGTKRSKTEVDARQVIVNGLDNE